MIYKKKNGKWIKLESPELTISQRTKNAVIGYSKFLKRILWDSIQAGSYVPSPNQVPPPAPPKNEKI